MSCWLKPSVFHFSPRYNTAAALCLEGYASFQINHRPGNRLTASELQKNGVLRGAKNRYPLVVEVVGGPRGSGPSDLGPRRCPFFFFAWIAYELALQSLTSQSVVCPNCKDKVHLTSGCSAFFVFPFYGGLDEGILFPGNGHVECLGRNGNGQIGHHRKRRSDGSLGVEVDVPS